MRSRITIEIEHTEETCGDCQCWHKLTVICSAFGRLCWGFTEMRGPRLGERPMRHPRCIAEAVAMEAGDE